MLNFPFYRTFPLDLYNRGIYRHLLSARTYNVNPSVSKRIEITRRQRQTEDIFDIFCTLSPSSWWKSYIYGHSNIFCLFHLEVRFLPSRNTEIQRRLKQRRRILCKRLFCVISSPSLCFIFSIQPMERFKLTLSGREDFQLVTRYFF